MGRFDPSWYGHNCYIQEPSSIVPSPPYELAIPHIEVRVLCISGAKTSLRVPSTLTGADVKLEAIQEFQQKSQLPEFRPNTDNCVTNNLIELSQQFKLTRISRIHGTFDETVSLAAANIQNNETMLLIPLRNWTIANDIDDDGDAGDAKCAPTQEDIESATASVACRKVTAPAIVNIDELVLQSDVQYDIRKILISLANSCAYVIGAGPYATRLISMLKQRLIRKKSQESDTQQCLIDMGFSRAKVHHALHINK